MGRTGTLSLALALARLGYKTAHWTEMVEQTDDKWTIPDEMFEEYDAFADGPMPLYYEYLMEDKSAKFILTMRDPHGWLESIERHWGKQRPAEGKKKLLREKLYGTASFNHNKLWKAFTHHMIDVVNTVPSDRLLIMDITKGDGYARLCPFLGKEPKNEEFPHCNRGRR